MSSVLRPAAKNHGPSTADKYRPISTHLAIAPPVSVVIPAMNEAENLPYVFKTLPDWIHEVVLDMLVAQGMLAVHRWSWRGGIIAVTVISCLLLLVSCVTVKPTKT